MTAALTEFNRKPRSRWKDRFIYTMLGLFAGMAGAHNWYLKRYVCAGLQLLLSAAWISLLSLDYTSRMQAEYLMLAALVIFCAETLWINLEIFLVKREPDGDAMNDEAGPVRLLLIFVFWLTFIVMPLGFTLLIQGTAPFTGPVRDKLDRIEEPADK